MKPNIPWSVKGIDPEAREAAKMAARRAGMTLGDWLNSLILQGGDGPEDFEEAAAPALQGAVSHPRATRDEPGYGFRERAAETPGALAVSGIDQSIERLASTIETSRRMLADSDTDTKRNLNELGHRLEALEKRMLAQLEQPRSAAGSAGLDPRTLQALERAIAGVASHIEKSDRRNAELVASVERALGDLSGRVGGVEESASDAIGRLELAFDRLTGRIDQVEGEQRRSAARLSERVTTLDDRIGDLADRGATLGPEVTDRIEAIGRRLDRAESDLTRAASGTASLATAERVAREEARRLETRFEGRLETAERAAREAGTASSAVIEARLTGLSDRLDRLFELTEQTAGQAAAAREAAEARIAEADARIAMAAEKAAAERAAVESEVAALRARTDRTHAESAAALSAIRDVVDQLSRRNGGGRLAELASAMPLAAPPAAAVRAPVEDTVPEEFAADQAVPDEVLEQPARATGWRWGRGEHGPASEAEAEASVDETVTHGESQSDEEALLLEDLVPDESALEAEPVADQTEFEVDVETTYLEDLDDDRSDDDAAKAKSWHDDAFGRVSGDEDQSAGDFETTDLDETDIEAAEREPMGARERGIAGFDWSSLARDIGARGETGETRSDNVPAGAEDADIEADTDEAEPYDLLEDLTEDLSGERQDETDLDEDEDTRRRSFGRREPRIGAAAGEDEAGDDYLAQARRAARSAGETDRGARLLRDEEDHTGTRFPRWLVALLGFGLLVLAGLVGYFVVLPLLNGPDIVERPPAAATEKTTQADPKPIAAAGAGDMPSTDQIPTPASDETQPETAATETEPESPADAATEGPLTPEGALRGEAEADNAQAQYALALAYQSGQGEAQDPALTIEWMRRAADQELAVAQFALGYILEKGSGVPADEGEARRLYEKAARGGNVKAMHNLAMFHVEGKGGLPASGPEAERWFSQAADLGLGDSQMNLAILYHQGSDFGLETSEKDAYFWYSIAGNRGDAQAREYAANVGAALPEADKSEIDARIAAWKPKRPNLTANGGFDTSAESFMPLGQRTPLTRTELTRIQEALNSLGYDAGPADGRPGSTTEEAIRAFQKDYQLPVNGVADRNLLTALGVVPR